MHTLLYNHIFNVKEPIYEELVCEFFSTSELHGESVSFRLVGYDHELSMKESVGVVNTIDATILSHVYRGIPVDMMRVFARIAKYYAIDTCKQTLELGPFITRIARLCWHRYCSYNSHYGEHIYYTC